MATIITKNSQTASAVPSAASLEVGELAVNTADGKLYTEHTGGVVKQVGGNTQTISAGTGISVTNPSSTNPTITNTGVTSVAAGTGISVSASTGGVTISASGGGVTSLNGQTGAITNTDLYAIGSYIVGRPADYTTYSVNSTIAGSSLYTSGVISYYDGGSFKNGNTFVANTGGAVLINTGTWRATSAAVNGGATNAQPGLWVRIS
jgi:hypothetical protein